MTVQHNQPPTSLHDRINACVAAANAHLVHWMPFTITEAVPDAGDGLTCSVTIQTDGGDLVHTVFALQFLSPMSVAEAGTRAYLALTRGLEVWDGSEDTADVTPPSGYVQ